MGLAAILIANSHLESLYPRRWMAADGLLGNTLFFVLAGFGILLSQSQRPSPFLPFYAKRFLRIYPSFWIALLIAAASGMTVLAGTSPADRFSACIWPTSFSFIGLIMVFYPALWIISRFSKRHQLFCIGFTAALWLGIWFTLTRHSSSQNLTLGQLPNSLWWASFGLATGVGAIIATKPLPTSSATQRWALLGGFFVLYLVIKFELSLRKFTTPDQFPSILFAGALQLLAIGCAAVLLLNLNSLNALLQRFRIQRILSWIGQASLQIYVLHMTVYHWVHQTNLAWPTQLALFAAGTMISSRALLWLAKRISHFA